MFNTEERLLSLYFGNDPEKMKEARARLAAHEPIAYVLGETVFFDETYYVTPDVLIPRPDTERVVEKVIRYLPDGGKLLDLCTGSGCIAISALRHTKNTLATLLDISEGALKIAKKNAVRNGVADRCAFLAADLRARPRFADRYDVIVSNPPYVASSVVDTLEEECSREPRVAFDGGEDGGDFYRLLLDLCPQFLKSGGKLIFEIGYDQRGLTEELCRAHGYAVAIYKDYGKNDRVAVIDPEKIYGEPI